MPAIIPAVAAAFAADAATTMIGEALIPYAFAGNEADSGGGVVGAIASLATPAVLSARVVNRRGE